MQPTDVTTGEPIGGLLREPRGTTQGVRGTIPTHG